MLRFAGGLHIVSGRIVVEAEIDTGATARRLRKDIAEVYGHASDVAVVAPGGLRKGSRYLVRVAKDGEALARQTGLLDGRGRPVRGLPPQVVSGAHRATRSRPGAARSSPTARSPSPAGRRRWRSPAPARRPRWRWSAPPAGSASAPRPARCAASTAWSSATATRSARCSPGSAPTTACWPGRSGGCAARCARPPTGWPTSTTPTCAARRGPRSRPAPGCSARWRSSATTSPTTCAAAGELRLAHKQASLEELGALADPPMTKDAVAGRIRRLLAMADKRAADHGVPGTEANLTPDMLDA